MGTRSLTHIKENGKVLVTIYRQYDGYPEGMGADIAKFLLNITVVNGLGSTPNAKIANGMGCLAAQFIADIKKDTGNVYIYPPNSKDVWEEYTYNIILRNDVGIMMNVNKGKYYTPIDFINKYVIS